MIYVASKLHSTILVLDAKTGVPLRTVRVSEEVEDRAVDIVASPIGNILHVVTFGRGGTKLFAVDMGANELLKRKSFGIAVFTSALSISRTGKYIFLGSLGTAGSERTPGKTLIIDPRTYDVLGEVEVGHTPVSIISGVDESIFYVANNGELPGTVTIGSVDNKQTKQSINVPSIPTGLAFSGSEDVLFVLTALDQTRITEINRRDLTVNKSYIVGPFGVATASKTQMEQKCSHHKLTEILNTQSVRKAGRS
jgi:DNA-binding beta-propeller fold protein YncE